MKKTIMIGKHEVKMAASAFTPFVYKELFNEDIIKGMRDIQSEYKDGNVNGTFITKVSYAMAKEANLEIEPFEEWLKQFEIFDIYQAFPEIIAMWGINEKQNAVARKK